MTVDPENIEIFQSSSGEVAENDPSFFAWILRLASQMKEIAQAVITPRDYLQTTVLSGSAVALVNNTAKSVCKVTLTPGTWDVSAVAAFFGGGTTTITELLVSLSLTTNVIGTDGLMGRVQQEWGGATLFAGNDIPIIVGPMQFIVAADTDVFLVVRGIFAVSTMTAYGQIRARKA